MTARMGAKGQVVVPKALRDEVGLQPGDRVEFELREDAVVLRRASGEVRALGGRFAGSGMLKAHMAGRASERKRDRW